MNYADFKKKMKEDPSFAEKFKAVKSIDDLVTAAAAEGYTLSADDVRNEKISLDDLDNVAGGFSIAYADVFVTDNAIIHN